MRADDLGVLIAGAIVVGLGAAWTWHHDWWGPISVASGALILWLNGAGYELRRHVETKQAYGDFLESLGRGMERGRVALNAQSPNSAQPAAEAVPKP